MKFLILNGPNLNLLGKREPDIYGRGTYAELCREIAEYAEKRGNQARFVQSNHEGVLIDVIQQAGEDGTDGIVLNPGAYTHYSYAIHDARGPSGRRRWRYTSAISHPASPGGRCR